MTEEELRMLIDYGEDSKTERKRTLEIGSKDGKAEFIRDMLSLVNAHDRRDAHMLIGVDSKGELHDINHLQLDDAQLQQIVDSLVEPPIQFAYQQIKVDGTIVGIITIPSSEERFHLVKKDYCENDKKLLERGDTWVRKGSSKGRPTAWDYRLLKEDFAARRVVEPVLDVMFANGEREVQLAADWSGKEHEVSFTPQRALMRKPYPPGTAPLRFRVVNIGNTEAENIRIFVQVPPDCSVPTKRFTGNAMIPANPPWHISQCPEDKQIGIRGDSLIHRLWHTTGYAYVTFPKASESYDLTWSAHAGNMESEQGGTLTVCILDDSSPPTKHFPRDEDKEGG